MVDPGFSLDSDHNGIKFIIDHGLKEITDVLPRKYCINKIDLEEWTKLFEQELANVDGELSELYETRYPSDTQLDEYADTISSALQNTLSLAAPERKPSPKAKPWWDQDLTAATEKTAEAKKAVHAYQSLTGKSSPILPNPPNITWPQCTQSHVT